MFAFDIFSKTRVTQSSVVYTSGNYLDFAETVPVRTVNRQCSSGLQAVADVAAAIRAGFYDIGKIACV